MKQKIEEVIEDLKLMVFINRRRGTSVGDASAAAYETSIAMLEEVLATETNNSRNDTIGQPHVPR